MVDAALTASDVRLCKFGYFQTSVIYYRSDQRDPPIPSMADLPKAVIFDLGGVVFASPLPSVHLYEESLSLPGVIISKTPEYPVNALTSTIEGLPEHTNVCHPRPLLPLSLLFMLFSSSRGSNGSWQKLERVCIWISNISTLSHSRFHREKFVIFMNFTRHSDASYRTLRMVIFGTPSTWRRRTLQLVCICQGHPLPPVHAHSEYV